MIFVFSLVGCFFFFFLFLCFCFILLLFYFPIPEDRIHPGKEGMTTNGEERSMAAETANTLLLSIPRMQGGGGRGEREGEKEGEGETKSKREGERGREER